MARPKSDKLKTMFVVTPGTLDDLDVIAAHYGWHDRGGLNRSRAVREVVAWTATQIRQARGRVNGGGEMP